MLPLALGLGAIEGISSLSGLLGASAAQRRAEAARQAAISQLGTQLDDRYRMEQANNSRNLYAATGTAGDAIGQLGRRLGSSLAGAGVYNSSAVGGALANAQNSANSSLSGLAQNNFANEQNLLNSNEQYLTGQKLGLANQQYGEATGNLAGARSGLASFLGTLGQNNLAQSGQNLNQASLTRSAGGYGGTSVLSPGAGFGGNVGGIPSYGGDMTGSGGFVPGLQNALGKIRNPYGSSNFNASPF